MTKNLNFDRLEDRVVLSQIPFVTAPAGVAQNAINFTSARFHTIVQGLNKAVNTFVNTGNVNPLSKLAIQVPFGVQDLLPTWEDDTTGAEAQSDLVNYLDANVGETLNVLQSGVHNSTDSLLTFNGTVGQSQSQTNVNSSIPFVTAPAGVPQFAINFTSDRFHTLTQGLNSAFSSGVPNIAKLTNLAHQVPFGVSGGLLSTWEGDTSAAQAQSDLVTYLDDNIGSTLNVLKSQVNFNTDSLLTFNGTVGSNSLT
jgi:hypothetical protein